MEAPLFNVIWIRYDRLTPLDRGNKYKINKNLTQNVVIITLTNNQLLTYQKTTKQKIIKLLIILINFDNVHWLKNLFVFKWMIWVLQHRYYFLLDMMGTEGDVPKMKLMKQKKLYFQSDYCQTSWLISFILKEMFLWSCLWS